jgi:hypothetical protein
MAKEVKRKNGKVIKLSRELAKYLDGLRTERESYDSALRRQFGLPSRTGYEQMLKHYFVIDSPVQLSIHRTEAEAKGEAILLAVRSGQKRTDKKRKEAVLTVRELP